MNSQQKTSEPLCIACKEDTAWHDQARNVYSSYCSGDCQKALDAYNNAVAEIKKQVSEYPKLINYDDFPPPCCESCTFRGTRLYDYAQKKYTDNCAHCVRPPIVSAYQSPQSSQAPSAAPVQPVISQVHSTPVQPVTNQPQYVHATPSGYQSTPAAPHNDQIYRPPAGSARPGPAQIAARLKNRLIGAARTIPSQSASRVYYQRPNIVNQGNLCAHCFIRPSSTNTNMGLFCNASCEQAETKVAGCGVLIMSFDYQTVVLSYMNSGPYQGKWSLLHSTKNVQELGRDCCVRIASAVNPIIAPTAQDPYCMVEHSTPNVFSYSVLVARDHLSSILPPSQDIANGGFIHVNLGQFYNKPVTGDIVVMDVNHKQRIVSRHTHKVINEFVELLSKHSGYTS